jgi:hypothetical protein
VAEFAQRRFEHRAQFLIIINDKNSPFSHPIFSAARFLKEESKRKANSLSRLRHTSIAGFTFQIYHRRTPQG